jgi:hypothetical protein
MLDAPLASEQLSTLSRDNSTLARDRSIQGRARTSNGGWGISAAPGTIDGGGNPRRATGRR